MNLKLFVEHLHQTLQQSPDNIDAVRDLLRVHIEGLGGETSFEKKISPPNPRARDASRSGDRVGGLFKKTLTLDEEIAVGIVDCVSTIMLSYREEKSAAEKKRRANAVRAIINSLSFSELEAASHVVKKLGGDEGNENNEAVLIAGQIADALGFARSVVTSALRKLEGADLIETRSLGMKGTYVRVKDALLVEELGKL
ncbi:MAG: hypothetical protein FWF77_05610 [Defluviitaleaceae bacterium]|nr:hypothetical protein [Defluviitaleaceae bacterium]